MKIASIFFSGTEDVRANQGRAEGTSALVGIALLCTAFGAAAQQEDENYEEHEIDEIIVEAAALARTVDQLAQPTAVLGGDSLTKKQASSIGETVSRELGVSSSYFGPIASRPVIRGQFGERVRVLSNGLDSLDASALSEDHAVSIDGALAERIEIVRGPATLLYGSGAAGGLVNIVDERIGRPDPDDPFQGILSLGMDTATGKQAAAGRVKWSGENLAASFDYSRRSTDNVEIPGFAESARLRALEELEEEEGEEEGHEEEEAFGVVENTSSDSEDVSAAFTYANDRGYVGISVTTLDNAYGIPGHHEHHEEEEGEEEEEEEESVRIDMEQTRIDARGEVGFDGPIHTLRFRLSDSDYAHTEFEGSEVGTVFDTTGNEARIEVRAHTSENSEGAFGTQFKKVDFNVVGDEAFVPPSETVQTSVFAFHEWLLGDATAVSLSARIEKQSISAPGFVDVDETANGASLGVVHPINDALTFSANYALTERSANATELYADGVHVAVSRVERGSIARGEGGLDRELSSNLDVMLHGDNERVEWTVSAFINDVRDYILLSPTTLEIEELQVFDYRQLDVNLYGFEAEARFELAEFRAGAGHLHARVFSDYVYGEESNSGSYLPRLPPLRVGLGVHFSTDQFETSVEASSFAKQTKTATAELPTDSYVMLSAEASYAFAEDTAFAFLRVSNVTDEEARQHTSPLKDLLPLPGRSVHAGIRWEF